MLPTMPDETPVAVFNPSKNDFVSIFRNDKNEPNEYIMPSRKIVTFPKWLADKLADRLARQLALENPIVHTQNGPVKIHFEENVKQQKEKIFITI